MRGLSEEYDVEMDHGIILYGSRNSLEVKSFVIEFDSEFWEETVLSWAKCHTELRRDDALPPAAPEHDWECEFCSYRERCGKGSTDYSDVGTLGLLPSFDEYPREKLTHYFEAHPQARLPPSLAGDFPQIAAERGVYDWRCQACSCSVTYESEHSEMSTPPACPDCTARGVYCELMSPSPAEQQQIDLAVRNGEQSA
jgi:hypothetical protein